MNPIKKCGKGYVLGPDDNCVPLACETGYKRNAKNKCTPIKNVVEEQIIDSLTGKAKCVYKKMVDNNNNINWILKNFNDGSKPSEFDLKLVMATDLPNNVNGRTLPVKNNIVNCGNIFFDFWDN